MMHSNVAVRRVWLLVALVWSGLALPQELAAQWVNAPGTGWAHASITHHETDRRFGFDGTTESLFDEEARSITTSLNLTAALGVVRGVDVWGQVLAHRLVFRDAVETRRSTGLSDPRLFVRIGPEMVGWNPPVPVAVRGGVKFPVGDFPVDAEIIPLSEGQRDWELLLELGQSLHPYPLYLMGWGGYRWRETNTEIDRKPGDEWFAHGALGGTLFDRLEWKVAIDAFWGRPPERQLNSGITLTLDNDRRRLVQLMPQIGWSIGPGTLEVQGRIPVSGHNMPAGPSFGVGYLLDWSEPLW